jgi:predicted aminopeptidase
VYLAMPGYKNQKEQIIVGLLENEALTDGLGDAEAQSLLHWCEAQVAAFTPTAARTLADYGQHLAGQARLMARIVTHIEDGDSPDRLRQRLRQLTDDAAQHADFLRLLDEPRPTQDYLQALYRIAACQ